MSQARHTPLNSSPSQIPFETETEMTTNNHRDHNEDGHSEPKIRHLCLCLCASDQGDDKVTMITAGQLKWLQPCRPLEHSCQPVVMPADELNESVASVALQPKPEIGNILHRMDFRAPTRCRIRVLNRSLMTMYSTHSVETPLKLLTMATTIGSVISCHCCVTCSLVGVQALAARVRAQNSYGKRKRTWVPRQRWLQEKIFRLVYSRRAIPRGTV